MLKFGKKIALYALLPALIICAAIIAFSPDCVADALLPYSYTESVKQQEPNLDWWTETLGLSDLKFTVEGWKQDGAYDFEYLRKNPIIIAVIDSGVNLAHEIFDGRYGFNGISDAGAVDENGVGLYDVILRDANGVPILKNTAVSHNSKYKENDVTDDEKRMHGTHVTGIVATLIHELDLEQYIKILPIKASYHVTLTNEDKFAGADVKAAVDFAVRQGADVINLSLSSDSKTFAGLNSTSAHEKAVLVAAAGNDGRQVKCYPAALPNVIGVMNYTVGQDGISLSNTSNYGSWSDGGYDICAPGANIYSANGVPDAEGKFGYKSLSGTSMASPVVAFGAALLAMKYKALAGEFGEEIDPIELAELVRQAHTTAITENESGKAVGNCAIFDINRLVGSSMFDARIDVSDKALLKQRLGKLQSVKLKLSIVPASDYGAGEVQWLIGEQSIGEGFEIVYTPDATVGEFWITAVWRHCCPEHGNTPVEIRKSIAISVDYMLITADNVAEFEIVTSSDGEALNNTDRCRLGRTYMFTVGDLSNIPAQDAQGCIWYVNGESRHVGTEFGFVPDEAGVYKINVVLNGFSSKPISLTVVDDLPYKGNKEPLKLFTIIMSSIVGAVAISVIIIVICKHRRKENR